MAEMLQDILDTHQVLRRLSVDEYHRMIRSSVLKEGASVELLDGMLVCKDRSRRGEDPMTVNPLHARVAAKLVKLDGLLRPRGCHMRIQQPLTLDDHSEPEPDGAIVKGSEDDYAQHPRPADVLMVIEVADSSLQFDRITKLRLYAAAGIGQYLIVNLADQVVELYGRPLAAQSQYEHKSVLKLTDTIALPTPAGELTVPVSQVLGQVF